jgi:hypothetical protein
MVLYSIMINIKFIVLWEALLIPAKQKKQNKNFINTTNNWERKQNQKYTKT